jgi:hypothetical protein
MAQAFCSAGNGTSADLTLFFNIMGILPAIPDIIKGAPVLDIRVIAAA